MFFKILLFVVCVVCFIISLVSFAFIKTKILALRINFLFFMIIFFVLGNVIIIPILQEKYPKEEMASTEEMVDPSTESWNNLPTEADLPEPDAKGNANLSLYVTDGANVSETYYVEATEKDTFKFCYFHEDGSHIVKKEVPANMVQFEYSNTNLPHRMEVLLKDGTPILYTLYLPEDSNAVQFDKDNK